MPCIVCRNTSELVVWKENGYEGRLCRCGTVYTSPEPVAIDPCRDTHSQIFYSRYALMKARWIQRLRPSGQLLELGCGEGHFLSAAKSLGYAVVGVEANPERARRVRERLEIEVRCALIEDLTWGERSFDIVYHCDMLSHFPQPAQALRRMSSLLAPGGILVCEAGTLGDINPRWYRWIGQVGFPQHRWLYSDKSLYRLFADAGLRIVATKRFGLAPAVALHRLYVAAARTIRKLRRSSVCERGRKSSATSANRETQHGRADAMYETVEQFFRYRIGALAPPLGPATLWIAARPAVESR